MYRNLPDRATPLSMFLLSPLIAILASPNLADAAEDSVLVRGPYLQLATPTSIVIVWRTLGETEPTVRYGLGPSRLDHACKPDAITIRHSTAKAKRPAIGSLHSAPAGTVQYEATIEGLEPDTVYYYSIGDGNRQLAGSDKAHFFRTHPKLGAKKPFRFWVVGDSGTGGKAQAAVHKAMQHFVDEQKRPLDFYLHVGDMAYPKGTDDEFQRNFFDMYQPTLRNVVCWASMGNHEGSTSKGMTGVGPYYDAYVCPKRGEAGGLPSATEAFYSFDYGNAHFICLDSHDLDRKPTGVMAQWLRADLDKTKADWLIAFWHHPPYTKGTHNSDTEGQLIEMRELIMPILESGGVDVVLTGHSHIYERSMLIDGAYHTPSIIDGVVLDDGDGDPRGDGAYKKSAGLNPHQGTVQVVTGHGGASVGRRGTIPFMKRVFVEHGSTIVDVQDDTLTAVMVNYEGKTRDLFSIVKRGKVVPQIVANPRAMPPFLAPILKTTVQSSPPSDLPKNSIALLEPHQEWDYLAGKHPPENWTKSEYVPEASDGWKRGPAGFGYGDDDDTTVLNEMRGKYTVVYARNDFELGPDEKEQIIELGLIVNYDDAFIAYLNGHEVLRVGVSEGRGEQAGKIKSHGAGGYEYFSLTNAIQYLEEDENILAIEGHNVSRSSSDFTLDPYLTVVKRRSEKKP